VILDLSHEIVAGMVTYPGLAGPELRTVIARDDSATRLADGVSFEIESLTLVGNTGTYLDSPFHFHADLADLAALPVDRLVDVPIVLVHATTLTSIGPDDLGDPARLAGRAVLVHTGWAQHWGTPRYTQLDCPHLSAAAAAVLAEAGTAVVGIDSLNIDNPTDPERPAHFRLLRAGIPIIEHLTNLGAVPDDGARLTALPAPVRGMATFPVRAVAVWAA
jgi:kynurenine formamidase